MLNFMGQDGFVWWIGKVVDIDDPLTLGRCKVRIFGYHGEESNIPNNDLPWATAIHPINTPNFYGTPRINDFVFGFFLDSTSAQEPAMLGYFPYSEPGGTKSFTSVTQKDSVVLDINGAKISISSEGNVSIVGKNVTIDAETVNINSTISTTIQNLDVDDELIISPSENT